MTEPLSRAVLNRAAKYRERAPDCSRDDVPSEAASADAAGRGVGGHGRLFGNYPSDLGNVRRSCGKLGFEAGARSERRFNSP